MAAEQSAAASPPLAAPAPDVVDAINTVEDDAGDDAMGESLESLRSCMKEMSRTLTNIDAAFDNDATGENPMLLSVVAHEMTQVRQALQRMSLQIVACYAPEPVQDPIPPEADAETVRKVHERNRMRVVQYAALQSAAQEAWKKNGYDALATQTV